MGGAQTTNQKSVSLSICGRRNKGKDKGGKTGQKEEKELSQWKETNKKENQPRVLHLRESATLLQQENPLRETGTEVTVTQRHTGDRDQQAE